MATDEGRIPTMGMIARQQWEKEQRRASILRAAEQVFAAKGAALVTMDDIAHAADLGKGTLYLYFDSKDELYLEIANHTVRELVEALEHSGQGAETGYDRVTRLLGAASGFALTHRDRFRVAVSWMATAGASVSDSERFAEYRRQIGRVYAELAAAIDAGKQDQTVLTTVDTPTLVAELLGALLGALLVELNAPEVSQRMPAATHWDGLAGGVVRLVLAGLRNPGAPRSDDQGSNNDAATGSDRAAE
jgi:AcrR family transcriptional regulator